MTAVTYRVPCMVTADVTLTDAGQARMQECVNRCMGVVDCSEDEARHLVLKDIVRFIGTACQSVENLNGFADLSSDDIVVGPDKWEPSWILDVEVVSPLPTVTVTVTEKP